ncbi:hypothetical protein GCM10018987_68490 [Streptomyces cremeus]
MASGMSGAATAAVVRVGAGAAAVAPAVVASRPVTASADTAATRRAAGRGVPDLLRVKAESVMWGLRIPNGDGTETYENWPNRWVWYGS